MIGRAFGFILPLELMAKILIVKDDRNLLDTLKYNLRKEGYSAVTADDLRRFIIALRDRPKFAHHPYNKPQTAKPSLLKLSGN